MDIFSPLRVGAAIAGAFASALLALPAGAAAPSAAAGGIALPPMLVGVGNPPPAPEDVPFRASSATGALPSLGGSVPAVASGGGRTFYIDFADGVDSNSGTVATRPWKHAPGDAAATGNAARATLTAGDTVRFKAGVPYRGTIVVKNSGTAAKPIVYTGSGYGQGRGVWDGADPVTSAVKCPNQAVCGGAANWRSLWLITYATPKTEYHKIYDAEGPLFEAMTPMPSDPFLNDDVYQYVVIPVQQVAALGAGRLENATLAAAARNEPNARLSIWVYGNEVQKRKILSVSGNTIYFDATDLPLYKDRDGKAAIVGGVRALTKPGLYALLGGNRALVYPRANGGSQYSVGNGRYGFYVSRAANIVIHGLDFVHGTSQSGSIYDGVALTGNHTSTENIRFEGNRVYDFALRSGQGVIFLGNSNNFTIRGNRFDNLEGASVIRTGSGSTNVLVEGNSIRRIGRTGIYLQRVNGAIVRNNILSDVNGIHGNAMSFYLDHQNVTVTGNCVFDSTRPLTFEGMGASTPVNNLKINGNILISSGTLEGRSGLYSWGANTRTVTIENNVAIGRGAGLTLSSSDQNVRVLNNRTSGILIANSGGVTPTGWTIQGNSTDASQADVAAMTLTQSRCLARGLRGTLSVNPS